METGMLEVLWSKRNWLIPRSWPLHSCTQTILVPWRDYRDSSAHLLKVNIVTLKGVTQRNNSVCRVRRSDLPSAWPDSLCFSSILGRETWRDVQRGGITHMLGKIPNQIMMLSFLPINN